MEGTSIEDQLGIECGFQNCFANRSHMGQPACSNTVTAPLKSCTTRSQLLRTLRRRGPEGTLTTYQHGHQTTSKLSREREQPKKSTPTQFSIERSRQIDMRFSIGLLFPDVRSHPLSCSQPSVCLPQTH
eukprot:Gb_27030 [translate_table: standard]